ncbi:type II toxin-antitoxin system Phd/YefM family antitoxin [Jiella sp. M17.18]|uniref:type II toxin-antitoxin system Phd/YefM family antitoxin n=1 Tax=Jiella sp. M17.18 TaxID=3234247 RepID=UPI0034DF4B6E
MELFTALDLQQRSGDLQRTASASPVAITHHGNPRYVLMSAQEFRRLKAAAGEEIPAALSRRTPTVQRRLPRDPLGRDTSDFEAFVVDVAEHALSGRDREEISEEIAAAERRLTGKKGGRKDHVRP